MKKALEFNVVVLIIFALILLVVLLFLARDNFAWINAIADRLFDF